jgi:coproporphyrinogen III oxidase
MNRHQIAGWLRVLQDEICAELEKADGKSTFTEDLWERPAGGGGRSRVISDGAVLEKGGVMFSAVEGNAPPFLMKEHAHSYGEAATIEDPRFFATGVSIVLHPLNPNVPIIHMNIRYFELCDKSGNIVKRWLGGGIDLTPHYINRNDAVFFHSALKSVCDKHNTDFYKKYSKWADDYFFIPHRNETRGIGGIFFDKIGDGDNSQFAGALSFWQDVGKAFAPIYTQLIDNNKNKTFTGSQREWQLLRRGRYVEFNLIYDKGTRFGLESNGRIESILVSLPPQAGWEYNYHPPEGSEEAHTQELLKKGVNWLGND